MLIKYLIDEDFVNYKKPCMFIGAGISCSFKCEKDCGQQVCQNSAVVQYPIIDYDDDELLERYLQNPITSSIVFGGLEPLDNFKQLIEFIKKLRVKSEDDIVIYTGYNEGEIVDELRELGKFSNIIIKFGRFIPDSPHHVDEVLGVMLASENQYAKRVS